ncbi:MAG TPA: hypothetical protein VK427_01265, partial [Kofleriaceae bacterium]|nr:hypothetical protein [Kofleriaceae bacterium]
MQIQVPRHIGFNFEAVNGATADEQARPEVFVFGQLHFSTRTSPAELKADAASTSPRTLRAERDQHRWVVTTADGSPAEVATKVIPLDSDWFGTASSLLAVTRGDGHVVFATVQNGVSVWQDRLPLAGVYAVTYLGVLNGAWLFQLAGRESAVVVAVDLEKGRVVSLARTQPGPTAYSAATKQLAILGRNDLEVWDLQ